jgi:hypothetical protein
LLLDIFERNGEKKKYDYPEWRILYQALAKYPTATTVGSFDRTINVRNKFKKSMLGRDLSIAITKYPHPIMNNLKIRLS